MAGVSAPEAGSTLRNWLLNACAALNAYYVYYYIRKYTYIADKNISTKWKLNFHGNLFCLRYFSIGLKANLFLSSFIMRFISSISGLMTSTGSSKKSFSNWTYFFLPYSTVDLLKFGSVPMN